MGFVGRAARLGEVRGAVEAHAGNSPVPPDDDRIECPPLVHLDQFEDVVQRLPEPHLDPGSCLTHVADGAVEGEGAPALDDLAAFEDPQAAEFAALHWIVPSRPPATVRR